MQRRRFISLLGGAAVAWPLVVRAQEAASIRRVGVLSLDSIKAHPTPPLQAFQQGLRELGWVEGQNLLIEWRFCEGNLDTLPRLASELVDLAVDVIVAVATPSAIAAKKATHTIPVVFIQVAAPVETGIVTSLARPGANVTGLSNMLPESSGKRLELLKEVLPNAKVVAVLWNRFNEASDLIFHQSELASKRIGLELKDFGISRAEEIKSAITSTAQSRDAAIMVIDDPLIASYRNEIVALARQSAFPIFSLYSEYVMAGGLLSYGPNLLAIYKRGATYVDRILKGVKPGDLPVEQPVEFKLVINLKTAKALGIEVPGTVLARADEVID
jgi:putative ABC transport system substrate-binding protein